MFFETPSYLKFITYFYWD